MTAKLNTTICVSGTPVASPGGAPASRMGGLSINGELVPALRIAAEAQHHQAPKFKPAAAWRKAANALAVRTLLLQEARRLGSSSAPREIGPGRRETDEDALIRHLLEIAIETEAPTDDALRAEYDRNPERFLSPPLWEVSHILVSCDPSDAASRDAARSRAELVASKALAEPSGFQHLARKESDCASRTSGGSLGQIAPGDTVPEFEVAVRELSAGQIAPNPVLTRHGWHIIRVDAIAERRRLPFETVRPLIAAAMEKAAWARAARAFVAELAASAEIVGADLKQVAQEQR